MAQVQGEELYLSHSGEEVDDNIDEVVAARGDSASLSARLADIVSDFEEEQERQDAEIGTVTVAEQQDRAALTAQVDGGAKNRLCNSATTTTQSNATLTVNPDGTVSVTTNGATSANVSLKMIAASNNYAPNEYGGMVVSGVPSPDNGTALYIAYSNDGTAQAGSATVLRAGETAIINSTYPYIQVFILVYKGSDIGSTPTVLKPMICTAADYAISTEYVPYAPTNRELYEDKATVDDIYGMGTGIPANSDLNDYRTGGSYYAVNSSVANSISNIPIGGSGFRLIVRTMNTASYCRQEFYKVNQPEIMYVRTYNGTWSAWYKFTGEALQTASSQSAPAALMQAGRIDAAEQTATEPGEEADA